MIVIITMACFRLFLITIFTIILNLILIITNSYLAASSPHATLIARKGRRLGGFDQYLLVSLLLC